VTGADLTLRAARLAGRDGLADVVIAGGRIAAITSHDPAAPVAGGEVRDLGGRVVTPGLVEAHIHPDKALLSERITEDAASVEDAIRLVGRAKRDFTVADIQARARRVLDLAVEAGTTAMRAHVEVDPVVGLAGMEAMLPLRAEYAPALDVQLCAFAQEGIVKAPGTEALLRRALTMGADLVGGCPYNDTDAERHVEIVFRLARAFDVDVDFHVDFFDEPEHLHVRHVLDETERQGWQGRVAVGHLTEMAALPVPDQEALVEGLAAARVGVIALPATDLYLMGRHEEVSPRRGLTPIRRLLAAGVPVALGTNNVRNPFTTVGTADLAHMALIAAVAAHMGTPRDLRALVDTLTTHPARILRLADYGVHATCQADLVVWDADRLEDVVAAQPARLLVVKRGRITVEHERRTRHRWR
jgi:cytosine deaminase